MMRAMLLIVVASLTIPIEADDHPPDQRTFGLNESLQKATWLQKYGPQINQPFVGSLKAIILDA